MNKFTEFLYKAFVGVGILLLFFLLYGIYPRIFSAIYQTGRDFGRSVVNGLMK